MAFESGWIEQYGYLAIAAGTFFEGERVVMASGVAARQGLLHPGGVFLAALVGSLVGDIGFYFIGRRWGVALVTRRPAWQEAYERVVARMAGRLTLFAFGVRFLYGMRTMAALAVGISGFEPRRFVMLNVVGGVLWAGIVTGLGYMFGDVAVAALRQVLARWDEALMVCGGILGVFVAWRLFKRHKGR